MPKLKITDGQARVALMVGVYEVLQLLKPKGFGKVGVVAIGKILAQLPLDGFEGNPLGSKATFDLIEELGKELAAEANRDAEKADAEAGEGW